jgi:hypothetical protein
VRVSSSDARLTKYRHRREQYAARRTPHLVHQSDPQSSHLRVLLGCWRGRVLLAWWYSIRPDPALVGRSCTASVEVSGRAFRPTRGHSFRAETGVGCDYWHACSLPEEALPTVARTLETIAMHSYLTARPFAVSQIARRDTPQRPITGWFASATRRDRRTTSLSSSESSSSGKHDPRRESASAESTRRREPSGWSESSRSAAAGQPCL